MSESETELIEAGDILRSVRARRVQTAKALRSRLLEHRKETRESVRKLLTGFRVGRTGFGVTTVSRVSSEGSMLREEKARDEKEADFVELKNRVLQIIGGTPARGAMLADIRREVGAPQKVLSNLLRELVKERKITRTRGRYRQRRESGA